MKEFGFVLATKCLVEEKHKVGFMYREEAKAPDSGWRFFAGTEDQAYVDDPDNIKIYDIQTILDIDPSIQMYLNFSAGVAFERDSKSSCFKMIPDYGFGAGLEE